MRPLKGPRPLSVTIFAATLGATACWNLGVDFQRVLTLPMESARIAGVSQAVAQFLIPVIPALAVWLFASRVARWFVTVMSAGFALYKLSLIARTGWMEAESVLRFAIGLTMNALVLLLFTPSANAWFARRKTDDAAPFR